MPAGELIERDVSEATETPAAAYGPNLTPVTAEPEPPLKKPLPVIVTVVPPALGPVLTLSDVTVGATPQTAPGLVANRATTTNVAILTPIPNARLRMKYSPLKKMKRNDRMVAFF
jgi:hypothetical protein